MAGLRYDELDAELIAANPWWQQPDGWEDTDVQLRQANASPLSYHPGTLDHLSAGGLHILRGPRRVGKSTELKRAVSNAIRAGAAPRTIVAMSVEGRGAQDLTDLIRRGSATWVTGEPGDNLWLIDEVSGVSGNWPAEIKRLRDTHPSFSADTVVLTGSSAAMFDEATKLLAGRRNALRSDRVMFQMSFEHVARALGFYLPTSPNLAPSEFAHMGRIEDALSEFRPWLSQLVEAWERYLEIGGYPQRVSAALGDVSFEREMLKDTLWDVIHGDAFSGSNLTHTQTQAILRAVTSSLSSLLSVQAVGTAAAMNQSTASRRLDALRRSFIAFPVHREQGLSPKPQSQSKWYFTDPALARLASEYGAGSAPDIAKLAEQQVGLALLRALERQVPGAALRHDRLLYYRSKTKAEIDFVGADFSETCFESKYVDKGWGRTFQTIKASGRSAGVVATRSGSRRHDAGWALPAGFIAFLLGR